MSTMASQLTVVSIIYSTGGSDADKVKHQGSASQAFVRGIHWWSVNSPPKEASDAVNVSNWWCHYGRNKFENMIHGGEFPTYDTA